jgi:catechol 2,3-dioxygenase-like lactoylglutathione lyase family enzyme
MSPSPLGNRNSRLINGAHIVTYTKDPEADRAFFRDVLSFSSVDAGHGWLIFDMPSLEAAFHDSEKNHQQELTLCAMISRRL